ncbi:hypothetical protein KM043_010457 [Ampulex compressa]|nr:hypothetical protein KM043_010457 [Ampulex compressa]
MAKLARTSRDAIARPMQETTERAVISSAQYQCGLPQDGPDRNITVRRLHVHRVETPGLFRHHYTVAKRTAFESVTPVPSAELGILLETLRMIGRSNVDRNEDKTNSPRSKSAEGP